MHRLSPDIDQVLQLSRLSHSSTRLGSFNNFLIRQYFSRKFALALLAFPLGALRILIVTLITATSWRVFRLKFLLLLNMIVLIVEM